MTTLHQPGLDTQLRDGDTQLMDGAHRGGLQPKLSCPSPFPMHVPRDFSHLSIPGWVRGAGEGGSSALLKPSAPSPRRAQEDIPPCR